MRNSVDSPSPWPKIPIITASNPPIEFGLNYEIMGNKVEEENVREREREGGGKGRGERYFSRDISRERINNKKCLTKLLQKLQ
jgi:hypothetical protein